MIHTDAGLRATREALGNLEEALLGLHRNRTGYHPATFELLAEPIRDQIRALRAEIDEYIGLPPAGLESPAESELGLIGAPPA